MQRYTINYFNEKEIGYFGNLSDCLDYAESFARNLILTYKGDIVIKDANGRVVARQHWFEADDGTSSPSDWKMGEINYMSLYELLKSLDLDDVAVVFDDCGKFMFADTCDCLLASAEADPAYEQCLRNYEVLQDHQNGHLIKVNVKEW